MQEEVKYFSISDAINLVQPRHRIFVQGAAATPVALLKELVNQSDRLSDVELIHLHTEGYYEYACPKYQNNFRVTNLFVGAGMRNYLDYERIDYLPVFLSQTPQLFNLGYKKIDVVFIQTSIPDKHGQVSVGTSVDCTMAAVRSAKIVIALINPNMPRIHGDGFLSLSKIHAAVKIDTPIFEKKRTVLSEVENKIGQNVANLISDGDCLQVGIGSVPDAVLAALKSHKNLGLHTEMWSDGVLDLIECGAIDNSRKKFHRGKSVSTFMVGSRKLYDFVDDNPNVLLLEADYVNNPVIISRNPGVAAINSAVEVDLTGQVCADSVGTRIISGVGGQMDFLRAAAVAQNGKPILAFTSRSAKGRSRIVPTLALGAGVVTTRSHVRFVVTEYGVADLFGLSLGQRAKALIKVAHPEDRDSLEKSWYDRGHRS